MSIWAEIKKAINSNLGLPLNEKIDRDIEENRIGHGFMVDNTPSVNTLNTDNSDITINKYLYAPHVVIFRGVLYFIGVTGTDGSKSNFYKADSIGGSSVSTAGSLPYALREGTAFVYNDGLYIMGSAMSEDQKKFYKYNGNSWSKLSDLPFFYSQGYSYVYKNKVYVSDLSSKVVHIYDGSTWENITVGNKLGSFFEKDDKLYSLCEPSSSDGNGLVFYYLDENTGDFVIDNDFPNTGIRAGNSSSTTYAYKTYTGTSGVVHLSVGSSEFVFDDTAKKWVGGSTGSRQCWYATAYAMHDDIVYFSSMSGNDNGYCKRHCDKYTQFDYLLPKNSIIDISNRANLNIIPVKNCELNADNTLKVVDNDSVTFRIKELYGAVPVVLIR